MFRSCVWLPTFCVAVCHRLLDHVMDQAMRGISRTYLIYSRECVGLQPITCFAHPPPLSCQFFSVVTNCFLFFFLASVVCLFYLFIYLLLLLF